MILHGDELTLEELYGNLWIIHTWIFVVSTLLILFGTVVAKFYRKKTWWLRAHRRTQAIGYLLALIAFILGNIMVEQSPIEHYTDFHGILGIATFGAMTASAILGVLIAKIPKKSKSLRIIHKWVSRVTVLALLVTGLISLIMLE